MIVLNDVLNAYPKKPEYLIEILLALKQSKADHAFTQEELQAVAEYLDIPSSRVSSAISFYSFFTVKQKGKYCIQICKDIPCYLNDSFNLLALLKKELGIEIGEVTKDGLFSLETTSCLGCCDISPAIRINQKVYGNLTANKVKILLSELGSDDRA